MVAVGLEHVIGFEGAPGSGAVKGHGVFLPTLADGVDDAPSFEDLVVPGKEGRIAKNGIAEEAFVGFGGVGTELVRVAKLHIDGLHAAASRAFGVEAEVDALIRLEADMHGVTAEKITKLRAEEGSGRATKDDDDFGRAGGEVFAGAKIERDAGPAPVIDLDFESGVGFGGGVGMDAVGLAIALVLGANGAT